MNVSLTPELEKFVEDKVESGRYTSASEVMREALRLLEEQERVRAEQVQIFQRHLAERLAAMDRGEFVNPEDVRKRLRRRPVERKSSKA